MARKSKKNGNKKAKGKGKGLQRSSAKSVITPGTNMPRVVVPAPRGPSRQKASAHSMKEAVCAITDPFCPKAKNAKWPDGQGGGTLTMQIRSHVVMNTGLGSTTNQGMSLATGSLPYGLLATGNVTGGNWVCSATLTNTTAGSNFSTYCQRYRIVSWGIIVRNLLPALTASGYVTITRQTTMPLVSDNQIPVGSLNGSQVETHPICAGMEIYIIGKPQGNTARQFVSETTNVSTNTGWDTIKIEVTGAGSDKAIDIEYVYNVEFEIEVSNFGLSAFVTPVVPVAPKAIEAANLVSTRANTIMATSVDKVASFIGSHAETAIDDVLSTMATFLGF